MLLGRRFRRGAGRGFGRGALLLTLLNKNSESEGIVRMDPEPWFQPKRSGLGLRPITWQGVCVTLLMLLVIFATVGVIVAVVKDPAMAVLSILVVTGAELAVFIPFTYRHTRRVRD
jgi:hypothetical protein